MYLLAALKIKFLGYAFSWGRHRVNRQHCASFRTSRLEWLGFYENAFRIRETEKIKPFVSQKKKGNAMLPKDFPFRVRGRMYSTHRHSM